MNQLFLLIFILPLAQGFGICATFRKIISLKPHKDFKTTMPYLWNYCAMDDKISSGITGYRWCYENKECGEHTWAKHYPTCRGSQQSPINIPLMEAYKVSGAVTLPGYEKLQNLRMNCTHHWSRYHPACNGTLLHQGHGTSWYKVQGIPETKVYKASGTLTKKNTITSYGQPVGCTKESLMVEKGFRLALNLTFQTQCCSASAGWKDELLTLTDGDGSVLFNQTAGFTMNRQGEVLINSNTNTAILEFCKHVSVIEEPGYTLSYEAVLQPLTFTDYDKIVYGNLENTGNTASLTLSGSSISGGPLPVGSTFTVKYLHFHWGKTNFRGSEHLLNGKSFPLEMHIVHANGSALAVTGFFFEIKDTDNLELKPLIDNLDNIKKINASVSMASKGFSLNSLLTGLAPLGSAPTTPYSSYTGSLTTPPCTEGVNWMNFHTPIKISSRQMESFRNLLGDDGRPIGNNYRGIKPINGRTINKINATVPVPPTLDYSPSTNCTTKVVTGNYFDARYGVENVNTDTGVANVNQAVGSYWLGPSSSQGEFIIDLGCGRSRNILELVNVKDGGRATKRFRVSSSSSHSGPWTERVVGNLTDSRTISGKLTEVFSFISTTDQFYKFELLEWFGNGGGLQYMHLTDCDGSNFCAGATLNPRVLGSLSVSGSCQFIQVAAPTSISALCSLTVGNGARGKRNTRDGKITVALSSKCYVPPTANLKLKTVNYTNNIQTKIDVVLKSVTFDKLLDNYVVVTDGAGKVVGCSTGRISKGASPPPPTHVMLLTGGVRGAVAGFNGGFNSHLETAEIHDPSTGATCFLPPKFSRNRKNHGQSGVTICGGEEVQANAINVNLAAVANSKAVDKEVTSCSTMGSEGYTDITTGTNILSTDSILSNPNFVWNSTKGLVFCNTKVCDLLMGNGTMKRKYIELHTENDMSCAVTDSMTDSFILIGGRTVEITVSSQIPATLTFANLRPIINIRGHRQVYRYNHKGRVGGLPNLIDNRYGHGCASYKQGDALVLIVTGGVNSRDTTPPAVGAAANTPNTVITDVLQTTEIWKDGDTKWTKVGSLPSKMQDLTNAMVTVDNVVYLTGGRFDSAVLSDKVLEWDPVKQAWIDTKSVLKMPRMQHGVSAVPIENLKKCAKKNHEVVMVAGRSGLAGDKEVEVYDPESKRSCYLPPLPKSRNRNSNLGLLVCGGTPANTAFRSWRPFATNAIKDCISFDTKTGIWNTNPLVTLTNDLILGTIWASPLGPVLFGGDGVTQPPNPPAPKPAAPQLPLTSTELLSKQFGGYRNSANLTYSFRRGACGITDSVTKTFILTGGLLVGTNRPRTITPLVERYSFTGKTAFPSLSTARFEHGCGSYTDTNGKTVFLVAGGTTGTAAGTAGTAAAIFVDGTGAIGVAWAATRTTEIFTEGGSSWTTVAQLPNTVHGTGSASLNNNVFLFGNRLAASKKKIYKWDGVKWAVETTDLKENRDDSGVSVVRLSEGIMNHCNTLELPVP